MAKINAHGLRQKGLTYYTERVRPASFEGDEDRVYYEAWRLRSDGVVQSRIIATWPVGADRKHKDATEHRGSDFTNLSRFKKHEQATPADLESFLERRNMTVVKRA
jgi:hypothetical protein